jgi:hypothetical protein
MKQEFSVSLYNTFHNLMLYGQDAQGNQLIAIPGEAPLEPQFPLHQVESFSLSAVKTFAEICDELIEMLLPSKFDDIVAHKATQFGRLENAQN